MAYTPGPWKKANSNNSVWYDGPKHTQMTNDCSPALDRRVAICDMPEFPSHDNEANARLIAAAPELLAALKDLIEQFNAYRNGWLGSWQDRIGLPGDMERAEVVVAKANLL